MSAPRRALWCAVLLAWPLVLGIKILWAPDWITDVSGGGAAFTVVTGTVLLCVPPRAPQLDRRRTGKQIADLRADVAALQAGLAETREQRASGIETVRLALDAAGVPLPDSLAADAATQPIYLRDRKRAG